MPTHAERDERSGKNQGLQHFLKQINEVPPPNVSTQGLAEKPDHTYVIDHVHGFSGDRNKSCLYFGKSSNEIVYMTAALGVVQDISTNKQRFFGGAEKTKTQKKYEPNWGAHQDDITDLSICQSGARNIVATGECGAKSTIHVWDSTNMSSIAQFNLGGSAKGVGALAISPCARYVAVVDQSNDHNMSIYNISKKKPIVTVSAGTDPIGDIQWSKKPNDLRFTAITTRSIQFWHPADATKKLFKNGTFGPKFPQTKFNCASFDEDGVCYSGGANGSVHCWDQRGELGLVLKAHSGECTAIVCNQGILCSTGKDFKITIHSANKGTFEYIRQISLEFKSYSMSIDYMDGLILIGQDCGRIVTVDVEGAQQKLISATHFEGEIWGLEIIEENGTFLTCADDNEFHEYNVTNKQFVRSGKVWTQELNDGKAYETKKIRSTASTMSQLPSHQQARAIAYSKLHNHVAVSNNQGDIQIFDYNDFNKKICTLVAPREWIECMKYSPDNQYLAVGAHDDCVYIFKISFDGKYTLHYHVQYVHSSAITAMDWTRDSRFLRAIDQAYSKQFYDVIEQALVKDGAATLTDPTIWETHSCKLGWDVQGVYPPGADGTDVNSVCVNNNRTLVAVGDDFGTLCVYRYPCMKMSQDCRRIGGHSEHVVRVGFYEDDKNPENNRILSVGGNDRTIIQWKAVAVEEEKY